MPKTSLFGRASWKIETETLRATLLQCGGHLAEIVLKQSEDTNPLWVQSRPTIDSDTYDPATHGDIYGRTSESRLLSGLAGHNLCFPFWGDPSPSEFAAGMTFHGETNIRRWQLLEERADGITLEVELPESAIKLVRRWGAHGHVLHCESHATNLSAWDRPFAWCEHVTMGAPFVESASVRFDASLGKGFVTGNSLGTNFKWPKGMGTCSELPDFDLTVFSKETHQNLVNSFLVEPGREWAFFTAFNRQFRLLFGYIFRRIDFPWLNVWETNEKQIRARAMEFSNTPHHGTMKTLISSPDLWGVPTYEWLHAHSTVSKQFIVFLRPVSADYRGTADVRIMPAGIEIVERTTGDVLEVPT
jgi:hypothetical protein